MQKIKFVKNLVQVKKNGKFLFLAFLFLVVVILVPISVFAAYVPSNLSGSINSGYVVTAGLVSGPMFAPEAGLYRADDIDNYYSNVTFGFCINNTSSNNYFIPTKSASELRAFFTSRPSNLYIVGCVGDGVCDTSLGESCDPNAGSGQVYDQTDCGICGSGDVGGGSPSGGGYPCNATFFASCQ